MVAGARTAAIWQETYSIWLASAAISDRADQRLSADRGRVCGDSVQLFPADARGRVAPPEPLRGFDDEV